MNKKNTKEIGFVGLGRMGLNMSTHLVEKGYRVVGFDPDTRIKAAALDAGIEVSDSYKDMTDRLSGNKVIWMMVPSSLVDSALEGILPLLTAGDTVIDGGNSFYKDSLRRHKSLQQQQIKFLDVGMPSGASGARNGASLMVGGEQKVFDEHEDLFKSVAAVGGYARVGESGAGHFVKMVHNGIEYGMIAAVAEGMNVLHEHEGKFGIDIHEVLKPYEHESVISGKLVIGLCQAYADNQLNTLKGEVFSNETEVEMEHITTLGDVKILEAALAQRRDARMKGSYIGKLIAAMRNQFRGDKNIIN